MSSISPDLHGDIKSGQSSFLLVPVSRIDLSNLKSSRNFWVYVNNKKPWPVCLAPEDKFNLQAGLLWHKIEKENKTIGLKAEVLSFIPAGREPVEIMQVKITNTSGRKISFIPTLAIPIYARSANNLRDHRHVTSLLNRITLHKFGVIVKPTLLFDESGHSPNKKLYFVLGWDEKSNPPRYIYPTQEIFCGEGGDLESPESILKNILPEKDPIQGKEAMGALRFRNITLRPGKSYSWCAVMGIGESQQEIKNAINKFKAKGRISEAFESTRKFWIKESSKISLFTANPDFDNWFRWVSIQPALRRQFGCSFLPDFDYGKGGRGWRDLWQDTLSLILSNPKGARLLLVNNFSGVRIDGSNATIIGKSAGEFISDRNNISRVWMDHGIWPLLTLDLYLNETADFGILFEQASYFRNHELCRSRSRDYNWQPSSGQGLRTASGKIYKGTILEHLLIENLVQFFNVGEHNHVRLEGADWNDGLDMAGQRGESIAFSCMYAYNLKLLAGLLKQTGKKEIKVAQELKTLLGRVDYDNREAKRGLLERYFTRIKYKVSGRKIELDINKLCQDLELKSEWMSGHIRKSEWLKEGFFNGYYDNSGRRVEGKKPNLMRMILTSQVFAVLSGVALPGQIEKIIKNTQKYLFDKKLKGYHLNSDFKEEQHTLGRAFSFAYGEKENGAFFSHMNVMFAYGLYKRGYAKEAWKVLKSISDMAINTSVSKIYPCIPEYFNLQGRGMYAYLTGSASWFVLTLIAQAFGVRGDNGNLLIEPKLLPSQFGDSLCLCIKRSFAGRAFEIKFFNPKKLGYPEYRIVKVSLNSCVLTQDSSRQAVILRRLILELPAARINTLEVTLG